ncbi:MAG: DegV family protein [Roseburia sp.]
MKDYIIMTDSTADLPDSYLNEHHIPVISLPYTLDGVTYTKENSLDEKDFYDKMRNGSLPTTSQANPEELASFFEHLIQTKDTDILYIVFSSGLSGTYNSARIAASDVMEKYPNHRVVLVDSLAATLGEGLLVYKAVQMKESGSDLDTVATWLEDHKLHLVHNFTVDDLFHLYRGGRVSKTAAFLGTIASIKPILHVDDEGHLIPLIKSRGRKKSISALVDCMEQQIGDWKDKNDVVFISHGDCLEDAQALADLIKERIGIENFMIDYVGPTIGAHSGPGTLALFYLGDHR